MLILLYTIWRLVRCGNESMAGVLSSVVDICVGQVLPIFYFGAGYLELELEFTGSM